MPEPLDPTTDLDWVRALCARLCFDRTDGDDLAQEVWRAAMQGQPGRGVPVRAWLAGIAKNLARMLRRTEGRRERRERAVARAETIADTAQLVAEAESQQRVLAAVNALPLPLREVVLLRFYEGLPPRAIAQRLAAPVATVRTRLARAQAQLKARLDRYYGDRRLWLAVLATLPRPHHVAEVTGSAAVLVQLGVVAMGTKKLLFAATTLVALLAVPTVLALSSHASWPEPPDWSVDAPVAALFEPALRRARPIDEGEPTVRREVEAKARTLRGLVVDEQGAPIAGAVVTKWPKWMGSYLLAKKGATAMDVACTTDAQGAFELTALGADVEGVHVAVEHEHHVPVMVSSLVAFDVEARLVMLRTVEMPLEVEVVEKGSGEPVPFFTVDAWTLWKTGRETNPQQSEGQLLAPNGAVGRNGLCRTTARTAVGRALTVHAMVPGHGPGEYGTIEPLCEVVEGADGRPVRLRFEVEFGVAEQRAARVQRGRVVAAKDGSPIAGVVLRTIVRESNGWSSNRAVQTRRDGTFALALPKDGRRCTVQLEDAEWQADEQDEAPERELVFRAEPRSSLRVRVVDPLGTPLVGAHVLALTRGDDLWRQRLRTDADGYVALKGLLARRTYVFVMPSEADPDERAIASDSYAIEAGETREETLVVDAADRTRVFGTVIGGPSGLVPHFVPTSETGRFVEAKVEGCAYDAGGLARGEYLVVLHSANERRGGPVVLLPGTKVTSVGTEALDLLVPSGQVRGRIGGLEADALRELRVTLVPAGARGVAADLVGDAKYASWAGIPVDSQGAFEVPFVADGPWTIAVWRGAMRIAERAVDVRGSADLGEWHLAR